MLLKGEVMQPEVNCPSSHLSETCCWHQCKNELTFSKVYFCIFNSHFSAFLETRLELMLLEIRGQGFSTVNWSKKQNVKLSIWQWDCEASQPQWKAVRWRLQPSSFSYSDKRLLFSPWVLWKDWTSCNLPVSKKAFIYSPCDDALVHRDWWYCHLHLCLLATQTIWKKHHKKIKDAQNLPAHLHSTWLWADLADAV